MSSRWLEELREERERERNEALAPAHDWGAHICVCLYLTMVIIATAVYTIGLKGMFKPYDDAIVSSLFVTFPVMYTVTFATGRKAKGTDTVWTLCKRALKYQLTTFAIVFTIGFMVASYFV